MIAGLVLKAFAISIIGLGASRLAQRARASVRHAILLSMFIAIAVLPPATVALPSIDLPMPFDLSGQLRSANAGGFAVGPLTGNGSSADATTVGDLTTRDIDSEGPGFSWGVSSQAAIVGAWFAVSFALLGTAAIGIFRVQQLRRTALPASDIDVAVDRTRPRVDLLMHESLTAPIAVGILRPAIIMPREAHEWPAAALHRALVHELEHVRRRDWPTQMFARAICALLWFNPLVWMAYRRLLLNAEYACDDAVVSSEEGTVYADQLVTLARRMNTRTPLAALGMAQRSDLAARVHAVLDASKIRGRAGATRTTAVAIAAAALLMAIAPLRMVAAPLTSAPAAGAAEQRQRRAAWRDRALLEAIDGGDIQDVRELLADGANVNATVDGDGSPLIVAAREGHIEIVRLLLEHGADVNLAVPGDGAPLIMAAREGHGDIVQLLLDHGAKIDMMVAGDENALIQASGEGELEVVKLLVSRGANVNARVIVQGPYDVVTSDKDGQPRAFTATRRELRTPLRQAVRGGHTAVADFLRASGAVE